MSVWRAAPRFSGLVSISFAVVLIASCASPDHGEPFAKIFVRYDRDFYKIDPLLFSPAVIQLVNVDSGHCFQFGELLPKVLQQSFCG